MPASLFVVPGYGPGCRLILMIQNLWQYSTENVKKYTIKYIESNLK